MLADELLRHRAGVDQARFAAARQRLPGEPADGVHQAHVQEDQLEGAFVQVGLQWQAGAVAVRHLGGHPGHGEQLDVAPNGGARLALGDVAVLHLAPGLAGGEVQYPQHPRLIAAGGVLQEVVAVGLDDAGVNGADGLEPPGLGELPHRLRHPADEQIVTQRLEREAVQRVEFGAGNGERPAERLDLGCQALLPGAAQELGERHRAHVQIGDAAHGHRQGLFGERELHQRSSRQHRLRRHVLQEVAQGGQRRWCRLNLVEKEHGARTHLRVRDRLD